MDGMDGGVDGAVAEPIEGGPEGGSVAKAEAACTVVDGGGKAVARLVMRGREEEEAGDGVEEAAGGIVGNVGEEGLEGGGVGGIDGGFGGGGHGWEG